jgi:hypothetical protein
MRKNRQICKCADLQIRGFVRKEVIKKIEVQFYTLAHLHICIFAHLIYYVISFI